MLMISLSRYISQILLIGFIVGAPVLSASSVKISSDIRSFLSDNCIKCHGPKKQKGSIRLDSIPTTIADEAIAQRWQDVLDVINLDEMPPEEADQPTHQSLTQFIESLTQDLREARLQLVDTGGRNTLRRMNRREYEQTIRYLFNVPVDTDFLPEDNTVDGFDTIGSVQSFSSLHLERYLEIGRRVLDQVIPSTPRKPTKTFYLKSEPEVSSKKGLEKLIPRIEKSIINFSKTDKRKLQLNIAKTERDLIRKYFDEQHTQTGVLIPYQGINPNTWIQFNKSTQPGTYKVRLKCGAHAGTPQNDLFLKVIRGDFRSQVPDDIQYIQVSGTIEEPQIIEFDIEIDGIQSNRWTFERRNGKLNILDSFSESRKYFFKSYPVAFLLGSKKPDIWIDWIEQSGPIESPMDHPWDELDSLSLNSENVARNFIDLFAYKVFRNQQPEKSYLDKLIKIYNEAIGQGEKENDALKDALSVVLASPRFLYLNEPQSQGEDSVRPLSSRELAVRLSYFLWSAPPDTELFQLVHSDELSNPKVLKSQIDRMLRSERSNIFVESFVSQWLELDRLHSITPESTTTASYDDAIQRHSLKETYAFFNYLLQENAPAYHLIDSDYIVVNGLMSQFYGLKDVHGDHFRKVILPQGSIRGGILGQSSILTLTGNGERTSPVERGVFVLRKILNRPPPPAPANVPMLEEENLGIQSIKETLSNHMNLPQCASCHQRIDPLGFAQENFDPVGLWRTSVLSSDASTRFSIEASGSMPGGNHTFQNFHEMKALLSHHQDAFMTGLTESLLMYGLGRPIGFTDREMISRIVDQCKNDDYGLKSLIHYIVLSDIFQTKKG